jgi:hypothetical protein
MCFLLTLPVPMCYFPYVCLWMFTLCIFVGLSQLKERDERRHVTVTE